MQRQSKKEDLKCFGSSSLVVSVCLGLSWLVLACLGLTCLGLSCPHPNPNLPFSTLLIPTSFPPLRPFFTNKREAQTPHSQKFLRPVRFCYLVLSCLRSCCLVVSCLVLSCLVLPSLALPCLVSSCLVLCCLVLSCLSCLVLPCLVMSKLNPNRWPFLSYPWKKEEKKKWCEE